jgi:hypothetical protein
MKKKVFLIEKEKIISHRGHGVHREKRRKEEENVFLIFYAA